MAPQGMTGFVRSRHAPDVPGDAAPHEQRTTDFEDLKVGHKHDRQKSNKADKPTAKNNGNHQYREAKIEQQPHFYGTDAESIDRTVTSHDDNNAPYQEGQNLEQYAGVRPAVETPQPEDLSAVEDVESEDRVEYDGHEAGQPRTHERNPELPHGVQPQLTDESVESQSRVDGNKIGHMPGDSYPPTTSGNPSTNGVDESDSTHDLPNVYSQSQQHARAMQASGARTRLPMPGTAAPQNHRGRGMIEQKQSLSIDGALPEEVAPDFEFAPAPPTRSHQAPNRATASSQSQHNTAKAANHTAAPIHAQPAAPPRQPQEGDRAHERNANQALQRAPAGPEQVPTHTQKKKKKSRRPSEAAKAAQQDHGHAPTGQPTTEGRPQDDRRSASQAQDGSAAVQDPPALILDHDQQVLATMTYRDLKSESFDEDPKATLIEFSPQLDTLEEKMLVMAGAHPQTQSHFFAGLTIDEWEDAGDWFLKRYGEIAQKFKDVRRSKRKAAQEFEDEIEQRQLAVSKKFKATEDALSSMRQSGKGVLDGTPKKTKQTTKKM